jgi:hypothetical protein
MAPDRLTAVGHRIELQFNDVIGIVHIAPVRQ